MSASTIQLVSDVSNLLPLSLRFPKSVVVTKKDIHTYRFGKVQCLPFLKMIFFSNLPSSKSEFFKIRNLDRKLFIATYNNSSIFKLIIYKTLQLQDLKNRFANLIEQSLPVLLPFPPLLHFRTASINRPKRAKGCVPASFRCVSMRNASGVSLVIALQKLG